MTTKTPSRSLGLKLLLVCGLALLMTIPASMVFLLLMERTNRAETVATEIGQIVGGPQTFIGPVLAVPYKVTETEAVQVAPSVSGATTTATVVRPKVVERLFVIFPVTAEAGASTQSQSRSRGLFKVPVWQADMTFGARFDLAESVKLAPAGVTLEWGRSELLFGATNPRGAQSEIVLKVGERSLNLAPAQLISETTFALPDSTPPSRMVDNRLRFFGAPAGEWAAGSDAQFEVSASAKFSGAQRFSIMPQGKTTTVSAKGDWGSPSFTGGFLPTTRSVNKSGFAATWNVPFIARGLPAEGGPDLIDRLGETSLTVSFVETANPYQAVSRSLKYAPMFLGLVFLAYFLFETAQKKRIHPAQYVLIGLAQIVFYLLLLSIAERTGFDIAFVISAVATVGLIAAYAGWVFESRKQGFIALVCFSALYGLIYVLMRLEDFALLIGALTSFAAIAAVMYFTRRIDWYGVTAIKDPFDEPKDKA